jgi:DNA-binding SARP family transcriptional activator
MDHLSKTVNGPETIEPSSGRRPDYVQFVELGVLGPLRAVVDGADVSLGGRKQQTVLALLAASRGRPVSTEALVSGVYGEEAASGAVRTVQTYVSNLTGRR